MKNSSIHAENSLHSFCVDVWSFVLCFNDKLTEGCCTAEGLNSSAANFEIFVLWRAKSSLVFNSIATAHIKGYKFE